MSSKDGAAPEWVRPGATAWYVNHPVGGHGVTVRPAKVARVTAATAVFDVVGLAEPIRVRLSQMRTNHGTWEGHAEFVPADDAEVRGRWLPEQRARGRANRARAAVRAWERDPSPENAAAARDAFAAVAAGDPAPQEFPITEPG